jgi:catalase
LHFRIWDIPLRGMAEEVDKTFTANLAAALGLHRVWARAAKVMSSAVPPAA